MAEKMSAEALERALQIVTYWGEGSPHETVVKQLEDHITALQSEADRLREALEKIANFAPGYGEAAEYIAKIARHALQPELAEMAAREAALNGSPQEAEQTQTSIAADTCTDPDNCKHCRTPSAWRGNRPHAGIPTSPVQPAHKTEGA